jgi:C4-dicarboxylate-specific signal transduction histidine kinase
MELRRSQPAAAWRHLLQQVIMNLLHNAAEAMSAIDDRSRKLIIGTGR